jgi:CDGSH-type Zn-finger protein
MSLLSATQQALRTRTRRSREKLSSASSTRREQPASTAPVLDAPDSQTQRSEPQRRLVVTITPYQDGPYLLRGPFSLVDQDGAQIPNVRRVVALCRCGKSRNRPFCDGTHRLVDFRAPSGPERPLDLSTTQDTA